jgi:hypothetical protein
MGKVLTDEVNDDKIHSLGAKIASFRKIMSIVCIHLLNRFDRDTLLSSFIFVLGEDITLLRFLSNEGVISSSETDDLVRL